MGSKSKEKSLFPELLLIKQRSLAHFCRESVNFLLESLDNAPAEDG